MSHFRLLELSISFLNLFTFKILYINLTISLLLNFSYKTYVLTAVTLSSSSSPSTNVTGSYVMSEDIIEDRSYPFMYPGADEKGEIVEFLCTGNANCIRLSSCHIMVQLLDKSCLQTHKLRELTCGYTDGEPMVCCPNQNVLPSRPQAKPTTTTTKPSFISNSNEQNCGLPHLYNWQANNYKGIGSQPWVVRVGFKNKLTGLLEHPCCGSIIGPRVVLTAAHCALRKPETLRIVSVRVGEFDLSNNPDCTQTFCALPVQDVPLGHVVVHPGYSSKNYRHNVALLVLKNRLNYSVTVQPICLHQSHSPLEGSRAKLVGWGKLPGDTETRKRQQQLELPVISLDHCVRIYGSAVPLNDNEICVGGEEGKDACSGFGGAPLLLLQQYSHPVYTQIGIVSFGSEKCGLQGVPSVYVRVDQYTEWIKLNSPQE